MKGQIVIKGFLDPRIGDELVIKSIQVDNNNPYHNPILLGAEAVKGFTFREWFIEWEDGKITSGLSNSGPTPNSPLPDRKAFRAKIEEGGNND